MYNVMIKFPFDHMASLGTVNRSLGESPGEVQTSLGLSLGEVWGDPPGEQTSLPTGWTL